jgi:hypothetical protein
MSFFVLVFDRHTRELRASERYEDMESAGDRMTELDADPSTCACTVEADEEAELASSVRRGADGDRGARSLREGKR